tara:strand:+ start:1962 stop:2648 length:687 start_codon:yes stop_codon:yes gene_type:complete
MSINTLEFTFSAADQWELGALAKVPASSKPRPGVITVPASLHQRDAWLQTADTLAETGIASLLMDIRGRGMSTGNRTYAQMGPLQRRNVRLDVTAAISQLAQIPGVDPNCLAIVGEQDTAVEALEAAVGDSRIKAACILSARHRVRLTRALGQRPIPVFGIVSAEDRLGLRATTDAYLAAPEGLSRLDVYRGLGIGITMASVLRFESPDQTPLEATIAEWFSERLNSS